MRRRRIAVALFVLVVTVSAGAMAGAGDAARPDILVRLRPGSPAASSNVLARAGATLVAKELELWRLPARSAAPALRILRASDAVVFAEREATYTAAVSSVSASDPFAAQEWWRSAIGVDTLTPPGPGVSVSLVDSGVDLGHPEFAGRPNLIALNTQEPQPLGGVHGTAVASVVGAQENGVGVVGVYPNAVIRSWDAATGNGAQLTTSAIVTGILEVSQVGKTVINLSLGGPGADPAIKSAVDLAVARGSLVVAASGNDGEDGNALTYPAPTHTSSRLPRPSRTERSRRGRAVPPSSTSPPPVPRSPWRPSIHSPVRPAGRPRTERASRRRSSRLPPPGSGRRAPTSTPARSLRSSATPPRTWVLLGAGYRTRALAVNYGHRRDVVRMRESGLAWFLASGAKSRRVGTILQVEEGVDGCCAVGRFGCAVGADGAVAPRRAMARIGRMPVARAR